MKILEWSTEGITHPLVVVGFPSQGLVGGIASNFLIEATDMWLHATVHDDDLPPVASFRKGVALSPVQVFAGSMRCGLDGNCDQLVVIRSDVVPEPSLWSRLADAMLVWAREKEARLVVALEGVKMPEDGRGGSMHEGLFGASTASAHASLAATGAVSVPDTTLSSFAAALLVKALERRENAIALFAETWDDRPDSIAAARILASVRKLVPHVPIDPKPLLERAETLERRLRADMDQQREALERIQSNVMYV